MRKAYARYIALTLLALALAGCGAQAAQPPLATPAATAPQAERARACEAPQTDSSATTAPAAEPGALAVSFDGDNQTIVLQRGSVASLAAVSGALGRPELLRELTPGEWLLATNLRIERGATLSIATPEVRWLKLQSTSAGFVNITAEGGKLSFNNSCVSSWDTPNNNYDKQYSDGRSFVLARNGAQMQIQGAELRYLGYDAHESYGVSWRVDGTRGEIVNSVLAYNYFGLYSYEVSDLVIRGNEVHHNVLYGLDPHTRSLRLVIEDNDVHHNGKHGIILADECSDGVIRNNRVYNNLHHGIVLYQGSNNNLVEANSVYSNGDQGLNVNDASNNTLRANHAYDNLEAGIGIGQNASTNHVVENTLTGNRHDGVLLYSGATGTILEQNSIRDNQRYGIQIKSAGNDAISGNTVSGNKIGVYLNTETPTAFPKAANRIEHNHQANIQNAL